MKIIARNLVEIRKTTVPSIIAMRLVKSPLFLPEGRKTFNLEQLKAIVTEMEKMNAVRPE